MKLENFTLHYYQITPQPYELHDEIEIINSSFENYIKLANDVDRLSTKYMLNKEIFNFELKIFLINMKEEDDYVQIKYRHNYFYSENELKINIFNFEATNVNKIKKILSQIGKYNIYYKNNVLAIRLKNLKILSINGRNGLNDLLRNILNHC